LSDSFCLRGNLTGGFHPLTGAKLHDVFGYTHQNAKTPLASLRIGRQTTAVLVAKLKDAILCKLAVYRKKDLAGLDQIIPKLGELGRLDWEYLGGLAKKFGLKKEAVALKGNMRVFSPRRGFRLGQILRGPGSPQFSQRVEENRFANLFTIRESPVSWCGGV